jgi:hypothetical protein
MNTNGLLKEGEIIKQISNAPDYYISNFGNAYTNRYSKRWGKEFRVLRHRNHPTGYKYLGVYVTNKYGDIERKWLRVHRVVATYFIGPIKRNMIVNHKDHNKGNNHVDNLEITTQQNNMIEYHNHKFALLNKTI